MSVHSEDSATITHETRSTVSELNLPEDLYTSDDSSSSVHSSPGTKGVKGADIVTTHEVGDARVALSNQLVRGVKTETIMDGMEDILLEETNEAIEDAVLMTFQARDIRGGKGEREIFYRMLAEVSRLHPSLVIALLDLIPEYGSWRDMFYLAEFDSTLLWSIMEIAKKQLEKDEVAAAAGKSVSLMAKWAPREGDDLAILFAWTVAGHPRGGRRGALRAAAAEAAAPTPTKPSPPVKIPKHSAVMSAYRKRIAKLNACLKTVETLECSGRWDEIEPKRVPARARQKKIAAYLNEPRLSRGVRYPRGEPRPLRCPDDPKRMACRAAFKEFFAAAARGEVKISGADTLYPHEVVKRMMTEKHYRTDETHEAERNNLNAVWDQMAAAAAAGGGLGSSLFMCDFSGSMQSAADAIPYWVSMAMGILGSAAGGAPTPNPFQGRFLTFDSTPTWHTIPAEAKTLSEKVSHFVSCISDIGQGTSTDFQAAGEAILAELKATRAPPGSAPKNLIVVTDMGFDAACSSSQASCYTGNTYRHNVKTAPRQTHVQMLREAFRRASEDVHGDPEAWPAPRIVIWNVAASYGDNHQAQAHEEGVLTLSGWSPSLFKVL